jgi:MFS family permease
VTAEQRTAQTYRYEKWRALSSGVLETASSTFLMLIAVRWFQAGAMSKAMVAGGSSVGLLLAPVLVARVEMLGLPTARAAARLAVLGAATFVVMALLPSLWVFVAGSILALACSSSMVPLLTQVYQENYPEQRRGWLFSRTFMVRIAMAAVFAQAGGWLLSSNTSANFPGWAFTGGIEHFRWLLAGFAAAFVLAAFCLSQVPSRALVAAGASRHPFRALRFARDDRVFRTTLVAWMFLGLGNLMMVPLRVEYLANPHYGVTLHGAAMTAGAIALLTSVLPNLARLVLNPLWGWLFDRMNFFLLRITLNFGFMLGILSFFTSGSLTGMVVGALLYGMSIAGGDVAWSLWVTKFAPPERVADYMSVHTFFTGLRGVVAPVLAFQLAGVLSLATIGWLSAGLILAGSLVLLPEVRLGHTQQLHSVAAKQSVPLFLVRMQRQRIKCHDAVGQPAPDQWRKNQDQWRHKPQRNGQDDRHQGQERGAQ